ncbi:MAG: hypothetical protein ACXV5Q_03000 [Frankiaceae bacterium]
MFHRGGARPDPDSGPAGILHFFEPAVAFGTAEGEDRVVQESAPKPVLGKFRTRTRCQ